MLHLQQRHNRLDMLQQRLQRSSPARMLLRKQQQLSPLRQRLQHAMQLLLSQRRQQLQFQARQLQGVSPLATLERGYAIVQDHKGQAITRQQQVSPGDVITARLHQGTLVCTVDGYAD
jgi:exodeoxyribonuclease VII large subunit